MSSVRAVRKRLSEEIVDNWHAIRTKTETSLATFCGLYIDQSDAALNYDDTLGGDFDSCDVDCEACKKILDAPASKRKKTALVNEAQDMVNHPPHYLTGAIQPADFITDQGLCFLLGNAVKYIVRSNRKGARKQDLEKAIWYTRKAIETDCKVCRAAQGEK